MDSELSHAVKTLRELGLSHWADKLAEIRESNDETAIKAEKVKSPYGGFGTINDNALSDEDAPTGMSGEEANKVYFDCINALYRAAEKVSGI